MAAVDRDGEERRGVAEPAGVVGVDEGDPGEAALGCAVVAGPGGEDDAVGAPAAVLVGVPGGGDRAGAPAVGVGLVPAVGAGGGGETGSASRSPAVQSAASRRVWSADSRTVSTPTGSPIAAESRSSQAVGTRCSVRRSASVSAAEVRGLRAPGSSATVACEALISVAAPVSARAAPVRAARSALPRLRRRCLPRCFIEPPRTPDQLRSTVVALPEERMGRSIKDATTDGRPGGRRRCKYAESTRLYGHPGRPGRLPRNPRHPSRHLGARHGTPGDTRRRATAGAVEWGSRSWRSAGSRISTSASSQKRYGRCSR